LAPGAPGGPGRGWPKRSRAGAHHKPPRAKNRFSGRLWVRGRSGISTFQRRRGPQQSGRRGNSRERNPSCASGNPLPTPPIRNFDGGSGPESLQWRFPKTCQPCDVDVLFRTGWRPSAGMSSTLSGVQAAGIRFGEEPKHQPSTRPRPSFRMGVGRTIRPRSGFRWARHRPCLQVTRPARGKGEARASAESSLPRDILPGQPGAPTKGVGKKRSKPGPTEGNGLEARPRQASIPLIRGHLGLPPEGTQTPPRGTANWAAKDSGNPGRL